MIEQKKANTEESMISELWVLKASLDLPAILVRLGLPDLMA